MNIISFENLSNEPIPKKISAEYVDMVELDGRDYLVTRIVDQASEREGQIDVIEVLADWCNGVCIPYGNIAKSEICLEFETIFNRPKVKGKITSGAWKPYDILDVEDHDVHKSSLREIACLENGRNACVGLISGNEFEDMKTALVQTEGMSVYQLQKEIETLRNKQPKNKR